MIPVPIRIRFLDSTGAVSGHCYARVGNPKAEEWRLSFRHIYLPEHIPRNRVDGSGWSNMVVTSIGFIHEIAEAQFRKYREVQDQFCRAKPRRNGFRKGYIGSLRTELEDSFKSWSYHYAKNMRGHLEWILAQGWEDPGIPLVFPWEKS